MTTFTAATSRRDTNSRSVWRRLRDWFATDRSSKDAEGAVTLYMYIRNSVTRANADVEPIALDEEDLSFRRLTAAVDESGRRVVPVDPRSVQWYFGATNLPEGNQSIAFGDRVFVAWDYEPTDPVVTRLMAYELARVAQYRQAGGELAFARQRVDRTFDCLLDNATEARTELEAERDAVEMRWRSWWEREGAAAERVSTLTPAPAPVRNATPRDVESGMLL